MRLNVYKITPRVSRSGYDLPLVEVFAGGKEHEVLFLAQAGKYKVGDLVDATFAKFEKPDAYAEALLAGQLT